MSVTLSIFQNECSGKEIRVVIPGVPSFMMTWWPHLQMPLVSPKAHTWPLPALAHSITEHFPQDIGGLRRQGCRMWLGCSSSGLPRKGKVVLALLSTFCFLCREAERRNPTCVRRDAGRLPGGVLGQCRRGWDSLGQGTGRRRLSCRGLGNLQVGIMWKLTSLVAFSDLLPVGLHAHGSNLPLQCLRGPSE